MRTTTQCHLCRGTGRTFHINMKRYTRHEDTGYSRSFRCTVCDGTGVVMRDELRGWAAIFAAVTAAQRPQEGKTL